MKIIHIANSISDSDGVSSHLHQLFRALRKKGVDQILLCGQVQSRTRFERSGIELTVVPDLFHGNRSASGFANAVRKLFGILRRFRPDAVHSHNHYAANISHFASKLTSFRKVQTVHGVIPETGRLSHFRADKFICVSSHSANYLKIEKSIDPKKIYLIRQGIDADEYIISDKFSSAAPGILCMSRLEEDKGVDDFVRAASILRQNESSAEFSVAGIGSYEKELKKMNDSLNAGVRFLGEVPDTVSLLGNADIVIMPSRIASEGFPMTVAEAGIARCLLIATELESLREVIENGVNGFLYKPGDYSSLAEKILQALSHKAQSKEMATAFRIRSEELFDIGLFAEKHMEVYNA